ncbi:MAG: polysaccharide pyruvyl transferase CsaB [Chloroflexota bacterium]
MNEPRAKTILIAGYYGFENVGDEAILDAILAGLRAERQGLDFIVVSSHPERTASEHGVRCVHWRDMQGLLDAARDCDLILLGGGGIFQDYWGLPAHAQLTRHHWGISFYSGIALLAHLYKKPLMIYAVGVGPLLSEDGKRWTRLSFELADAATVRDPESLALLAALGLPAQKATVKPDPALGLIPRTEGTDAIFEAAGVDLGGQPVLGVCLRNWTEGEKSTAWKQELASALDRFLAQENAQVVFIPFQVGEHELENDHIVALELAGMMEAKERVHAIPATYTPEVTAGLISRCHALVGMRLHSLIFAASAGVPALALAYDPKVHNFMRSLDLSAYALDLQGMDVDQLASTLGAVWAGREPIRARLLERGAQVREAARGNTLLALDLLDGRIAHKETSETIEVLRSLSIRQVQSLAERDQHVDDLNLQVAGLIARVEEKQAQVEVLNAEKWALVAEVEDKKETIRGMEVKAAEQQHAIDHLNWRVAYERQLKDEITGSRVYKVSLLLRKLRLLLLPPGGWLERMVKWLYRKPREILGRIREAIRRHGFVKAALRGFGIIGIRLAYPIKKTVQKDRYESDLLELERRIAQHRGFVDIFHVPMGWNTLLFQRFQHISLQVAKMGGLAIYGGHPTVDKDIFVYQEVKKNLLVFKATDNTVTNRVLAALEKRVDQTVILRIQSIDLVTTAEHVQDFLRRGFKVVYEYIDKISPEITGNVPDLVHRRHEAILKDERVIVVTTADQLYEEVGRYRSRNFLLSTNGVDVDHWRIARGTPPEDLKPALTGRVIVGYHGALAKWTDYELLRMIADEGSYELVLIGHEHDDELPKSGLKAHPRVHFLGSKSYFDLNTYAVYYDIAILPFRKSELTEAVSPVKIFEYMAARKPVVSTDLRECRKYRSCLIAETNEEFMAQLQRAVELRDDPDYLKTLDKEANENSWRAKTVEMLKMAGVKK